MSHRSQLHSLNSTPSYHSHAMAPSSHSPVVKVAQPQRTASQDSTESIRKRVCKACDRCRLKKSKCDGLSPCTRCKADNAICVFGERKKSHDKVYPKGYVEMLEQQQSQLVSGLQEMYKRLLTAKQWEGDELSETNGHPLTHDILAGLGLLESKQDGSGEMETFEEDPQKLQSRLVAEGAVYTNRRGSFSSESEHSQHGHARSMSHGTPTLSKPPVFKQDFEFGAPPTPPPHSPVPIQRQQRPSFQQAHTSSLQHSSQLSYDPQFYQAQWSAAATTNTDMLMRSKFAMQTSEIDQGLGDAPGFQPWDSPIEMSGFGSYPHQHPTAFVGGMHTIPDDGVIGMSYDPAVMDVDFTNFVQVAT